MATSGQLRELADLLDEDDIYDLVAGAIADARDKGARHPMDADSAAVLDHVIDVVRAAARSAT